MHIIRIEAIGLLGATSKGGWTNELSPDDNVHTLVTVQTSEGITGVGSVFTSAALVRASLQILEPLYKGESALEPARVSEKLHQHTFWQGRGGALTHTISGIDIALWDVLGKYLGQPVGRLLGGRYRSSVMPYASVLMEEPTTLESELTGLRDEGFRAFKIGWGGFGRHSPQHDEKLVSTARDAIGGDDVLAVDAGGSDGFWGNGLAWATRTSEMLASYGVAWFEEALPPDDLHGYVELRKASKVPISGGEVLTRRQSFQPFLTERAFDIVQPDVTKVGGLSEQRRIGWAAEDHGVRLYPHGWNTAIGLAADLQLASCLPSTHFVEYRTGSAYVDDLLLEPWKLCEDGTLPIPESPGLGVDINPDALAKFSDLALR